jgi:hypothetical protein
MVLDDVVLIDSAKSMRAAGESYTTIFRTIADRGASDLTMLRAAMRISGLGVGEANQLLADEGFLQDKTMILVDEDDPFYEDLFGLGVP